MSISVGPGGPADPCPVTTVLVAGAPVTSVEVAGSVAPVGAADGTPTPLPEPEVAMAASTHVRRAHSQPERKPDKSQLSNRT